jgi:hypothetical protein
LKPDGINIHENISATLADLKRLGHDGIKKCWPCQIDPSADVSGTGRAIGGCNDLEFENLRRSRTVLP